MKSERARLEHILDAIQKIEKRAEITEKEFLDDEMIQVWMIHNIQIIGEAARSISPQFQEKHPELPWHEMIGMRHILVHDYFEIDLGIVWDVVTNKIPDLKKMITKLLEVIN